MNPAAKLLVSLGVFLILAGLIWQFGGRWIQGLHLGRLPGDIAIEKENFHFYLPLTTSILLSVILTLVMLIFRFFDH